MWITNDHGIKSILFQKITFFKMRIYYPFYFCKYKIQINMIMKSQRFIQLVVCSSPFLEGCLHFLLCFFLNMIQFPANKMIIYTDGLNHIIDVINISNIQNCKAAFVIFFVTRCQLKLDLSMPLHSTWAPEVKKQTFISYTYIGCVCLSVCL